MNTITSSGTGSPHTSYDVSKSQPAGQIDHTASVATLSYDPGTISKKAMMSVLAHQRPGLFKTEQQSPNFDVFKRKPFALNNEHALNALINDEDGTDLFTHLETASQSQLSRADGKLSKGDLETAISNGNLSPDAQAIAEYLQANFDQLKTGDFITKASLKAFSLGLSTTTNSIGTPFDGLQSFVDGGDGKGAKNRGMDTEFKDLSNDRRRHTVTIGDLQQGLNDPDFTAEQKDAIQYMIDNFDTLAHGDGKISFKELDTFVTGLQQGLQVNAIAFYETFPISAALLNDMGLTEISYSELEQIINTGTRNGQPDGVLFAKFERQALTNTLAMLPTIADDEGKVTLSALNALGKGPAGGLAFFSDNHLAFTEIASDDSGMSRADIRMAIDSGQYEGEQKAALLHLNNHFKAIAGENGVIDRGELKQASAALISSSRLSRVLQPSNSNEPAHADGTDIFVIDGGGQHGKDVTSIAQATGGEGVEAQLSGVLPFGSPLTPPETRSESVERLSNSVQSLSGALQTALINQSGSATLTSADIQNVIQGLETALENFKNGEETLADYFMLQESFTLVSNLDPSALNEPLIELPFLLNTHGRDFSNSNPIREYVTDSTTYTMDERAAIGMTQAGYGVIYDQLESYAKTHLHTNSVSHYGSQFALGAAEGVAGLRGLLTDGLIQSGIIDESGNILPMPGVGSDEQPVRVVNNSYGGTLAQNIAFNNRMQLLALFPPEPDTPMGQSIAAMYPDGNAPSAVAAIANNAQQQLDDPTTKAGAIYESNRAALDAFAQELLHNNIILVVSSGNSGALIPDADPAISQNLLVTDSMVSVGASNANGTPHTFADDTLAPFSSSGADFVAEGQNLAHEDGTLDGTSFSAPQVSGLIARISDENPHLSAREILEIIFDPNNKDILFSDIAGTHQDGLGIINEDGFDQLFSNLEVIS